MTAWLHLAVFALVSRAVQADCMNLELEIPVSAAMSLSFVGFVPTIQRFTGDGSGNKIVLKNYKRVPMVSNQGDFIAITAGDSCEDTQVPDDAKTIAPSGGNTLGHALALAIPVALTATGIPGYAAAALGFLSLGSIGRFPLAVAQTDLLKPLDDFVDESTACNQVPITVDIYVDETVNELVMRDAQSGDFEVCPPESLYWKHHPDVFGGYEGCVGEKAFYPCPQDSEGVWEEGGLLASQYPLMWDGTSCVETGYTAENRTYWVLWGDPLDKAELNKRTGGPYPRYEQGVSLDVAIDDSSDARAMAKDLLVYIGAFTADELVDWEVTMTEGAESGMTAIWAAKALEIVRSTCNRNIYALMEVPAYGYSPSDAAAMVNTEADTFYNSSECPCFNSTSCNDPVVTISNRGWLPLTPFPVEMGGDGMMYAADSTSPSSPWMESMVFPENPSGKIKTPQLADSNRRVCDGVYVWPMYFGMRDYKIPLDERPDCSAWSFSITKAYSATVRAGFIIYKKEPAANLEAVVDIQQKLYSMTNGLYSEWSWYGQMQLWEMIMSRPLDDPTSWIGAYSAIMDEKWDLVIDAFEGCPVLTLTNAKAGAYAYFKYEAPYLGIQGGFVSSFFRDVLGIRTTTYNWGFRGANPADFYGEGYGNEDFTRLQLYRDVSVYTEIARRAKIVCSDTSASVGSFISVDQWAAGEGTTERRLNEGYEDIEERKRHLMDVIPGLNEVQLNYLAKSHEETDAIDHRALSCAPHYTTDCLFKMVGSQFQDF